MKNWDNEQAALIKITIYSCSKKNNNIQEKGKPSFSLAGTDPSSWVWWD